MLRELRDICGIEIIVVVCQTARECDSVEPGLSTPVERAVTHAADILALEHFKQAQS